MTVAELQRRLVQEREAAALTATTSPVHALPRTIAMVAALRSAAIDALFRDLRESRAFAERAVLLALDLPPDSYPRPLVAQSRAQALKDLATVRRHAADFAGAHEALDEAAGLVAEEPALVHDAAVLWLSRALTFSQEQAHSDALECLDRAVELFQDLGDRRRLSQCLHTRGMTAYRMAQYPLAISSFNAALHDTDDLRARASLLTCRGFAELELGSFEVAAGTFADVLPTARESDALPEIAGAQWGIARIELARGSARSAASQLNDVRSRYSSLGMPEEEGLVLLDLAEAHIVDGNQAAARAAIREAIETLSKADLPGRVQTAVAYLRELPTEVPLTTPPVKRVRTYIAHRPEYAFAVL